MISKLRNQIDQLLESKEELSKQNISLLSTQNKILQEITINNVHINNMSSVNKMITDTNKVTFTIESITSSEFNKECNMIPSFTEQDDNKCLADIVINK